MATFADRQIVIYKVLGLSPKHEYTHGKSVSHEDVKLVFIFTLLQAIEVETDFNSSNFDQTGFELEL